MKLYHIAVVACVISVLVCESTPFVSSPGTVSRRALRHFSAVQTWDKSLLPDHVHGHQDATSPPVSSDQLSDDEGAGHASDPEGIGVSAAVKKDVESLKRARIDKMIMEDVHLFLDNLMPGLRVGGNLIWSPIAIIFALAWFVLYFHFLYTSDRGEDFDRWQFDSTAGAVDEGDQGEPDFVIVLPHPGFQHSDYSWPISPTHLEQILVKSPRKKPALQGVKDAISRSKSGEFSEGGTQSKDAVLNMNTARGIVLQDLYALLVEVGFDVNCFSSIDDDEVFLCVSLVKHETVEKMLLQNNGKLQLRKDILEKLEISQPPHEHASSPALLRYDKYLVEQLCKAEVIDARDPNLLYRVHLGRQATPCLISSSRRVQYIYEEISKHLFLESAEDKGVINGFFPVHARKWIDKLTEEWAGWDGWRSLSFVQPIPLLADYFGIRVAFAFAWNGFYCKALLALLPLALLAWISNTEEVDEHLVVGFGVIIVLWAKIASNLWSREEDFFLMLWDVQGREKNDLSVRPGFIGTLTDSVVNANVQVKQYPKGKALLRAVGSVVLTLLFCAIVGCAILTWLTIFQGRMHFGASLCLVIMIKMFDVVFRQMVPWLTDFENHRDNRTYYNSFLWKTILFQSISNYSAFFYLAIRLRHTEAGCPAQGCLVLLQTQLVFTISILVMGAVATEVLNACYLQFSLWRETYELQRSCGCQPVRERSYAETQAKYVPHRISEQVEEMLQLALALGYLLFFGVVAPIIIPFCFFTFVVQLRTTKFGHMRTSQRPLPRIQYGIGAWNEVFFYMMRVGVLFSSFMVVTYSRVFLDTPILTRVSGIFVFCVCVACSWGVIDVFCPPNNSPEATVLTQRRDLVMQTIAQVCSEVARGTPQAAPDTSNPMFGRAREHAVRGSTHSAMDRAIRRGAWAEILQEEQQAAGVLSPQRAA